jgi:S1-C subfamily serine protease
MLKKTLLACVCLCLAAGTLRAQSEDRELAATARKTLQSYDKAVISLAAVIKIEIRGQEQEIKTQCIATIIDPSGLAVTSASNLNPVSSISLRGARIPTSEIDCQVQEVKYRLSDGNEVQAHVVLKDEDLDVAFLAPLKPLDMPTQAKIASVPLGDPAGSVEPLDLTIVINRASDDLNYIPVLGVGRVVAVVTTPRTCYLVNAGNLGLPTFDRHGKFLGIVSRCIRAEGGSNTISRLVSPSNSPVVLPAADIAKLVPQAKEEVKKAATAEKKAADGKEKRKKKDAAKDKAKKDADKKPADVEKKPGDAEKKQPAA